MSRVFDLGFIPRKGGYQAFNQPASQPVIEAGPTGGALSSYGEAPAPLAPVTAPAITPTYQQAPVPVAQPSTAPYQPQPSTPQALPISQPPVSALPPAQGVLAPANTAAPASDSSPATSGDRDYTGDVAGVAVDSAKSLVGSYGKELLGGKEAGLGTNVVNAVGGAVASYAGGKLANEIFDNKGYSDAGGSLGAGVGFSVGASAAAGTGLAAGTTLATYGSWAGPLGALAGFAIGSIMGSMMGPSDATEFNFRTYSGDISGGESELNKIKRREAQLDTRAMRAGDANMAFWGGDFDRYRDNSIGTTFNIGTTVDPAVWSGRKGQMADNISSYDGPFGKYTIGHIDDDIDDHSEFADNWMNLIKGIDKEVAKLLTPEEISKATKHLAGSAQFSKEWESKRESKTAINSMVGDRYAVIFRAAGRPDLYNVMAEGMTSRKKGSVDIIKDILTGARSNDSGFYDPGHGGNLVGGVYRDQYRDAGKDEMKQFVYERTGNKYGAHFDLMDNTLNWRNPNPAALAVRDKQVAAQEEWYASGAHEAAQEKQFRAFSDEGGIYADSQDKLDKKEDERLVKAAKKNNTETLWEFMINLNINNQLPPGGITEITEMYRKKWSNK